MDVAMLSNCQKAETLAENDIYKSIIFIKFLVSLATVVIVVVHLCSKTRIKIFHPNTKIIYRFICAYVFLMATNFTALYLYEMWRLRSTFAANKQSMPEIMATYLLFNLKEANADSSNGVNVSLIVLCIERLACICRINDYERSSRPQIVAFFLIFLNLPYAILHFWFSSIGMDFNQTGLALSTVRNAQNNQYYQKMLVFSLSVEYTAILFFLFIYSWSLCYRKKIRCCSSQSPKYQSLDLFPIVVVKCFLQTSSVLAHYAANQLWTNPTADVQMIIYELVNLNHFQSLLVALLMVYGSGQCRQRPKLCSSCCITSVNNHNKTTPYTVNTNLQDAHFQRLQNIFEKSCI
uniref:Gustatory receptor n=1 Tax=Ditylenchus dipsaci TaxID=166011 RepID=A0A915EQB0_9BILA